MKVSIIGSGSTALAAASFLKFKKIPVKVYVRNKEKLDVWNEAPLQVRGKIDTDFYVPVSSRLQEAIDFADILMICTRANDHEAVTQEIAPYMHKNQCLLFMNGCWGAVKAYRFFQKTYGGFPTAIAETANMPFMASLSSDFRSLEFKAMKEEIGYSCIGEEGDLSQLLHQIAPKVSRVSSPASTSLSATNPIIHGAQCLFNITRMENGEDFSFFGPPLTSHVADFIEACDKERLAIGKALELELSSLIDVLNSFWGSRFTSLHDALTQNPSYQTVKGPISLESRYLTEDLPCGLTSLMDLADMMHIEAPHICALVYTTGLYLQKPYHPFLTLQDLRVIKALNK